MDSAGKREGEEKCRISIDRTETENTAEHRVIYALQNAWMA